MSYKIIKTEWRTGKEIDAQVDRTIFELQAKNYIWKKTLSIKPRRCYWTGNFILPFSYAMVCHPDVDAFGDIENAMDELEAIDQAKKHHKFKWITAETYTYLMLSGKLR